MKVTKSNVVIELEEDDKEVLSKMSNIVEVIFNNMGSDELLKTTSISDFDEDEVYLVRSFISALRSSEKLEIEE